MTDSLNGLHARKKSINQGKMALQTLVTVPGAKGLGQLLYHMPSPWQGPSSVPSCCRAAPHGWTALQGNLLGCSKPGAGVVPGVQPEVPCSPATGPRRGLSSASVTQQSLINRGKACRSCLNRAFQWQTGPLQKIYQAETRYITEFLQPTAVTSVSQSAEC